MKELLLNIIVPLFIFSGCKEKSSNATEEFAATASVLGDSIRYTDTGDTIIYKFGSSIKDDTTIVRDSIIRKYFPPSKATSPFSSDVIVFKGDWTKKYGGWETPNMVDVDRVSRNGITWHGLPAAKTEVRSGDKSACDETCDRSEIAELPDGKGGLIDEGKALGSTVYFATSYKIPPAFQSNPGNWEIVLQLHGPDEFGVSPVFAFDIGNKKWQVNMRQGDIRLNTINKGYPLSNNDITYDKWTDFIIAINFQKNSTGFVKIWRRDEGESFFTQVLNLDKISTLQYSGPAGPIGYHYWKQGIYRSRIADTDIMWMGPFARTGTFEASEKAAFGTANGFAK
ncbi:MAG: heparin lyase I family protein [Bacteroidota bacterium]